MRHALHAALLAALLSGCFTRESAGVYARHEAGREHAVDTAVVESVRPVMLEGRVTPAGSVAGAVVGGIAGSAVGGGSGAEIAATLGAVSGYVAGQLLEKGLTRKEALEITLRLDDGTLRAIVQEADVALRPGERVRLVRAGGVTRVAPMPGTAAPGR